MWFCQQYLSETDLFGSGMAGGGRGTVGIGMARGPGIRTPTADVLRPTPWPLIKGSAGSGFCCRLGLSWSCMWQHIRFPGLSHIFKLL